MKTGKIAHYTSTGLLSVMMIMSASMYVFKHEEIAEVFTKLNYPSYIMYPLAGLKILGLIAIWTRKSNTLKEWAYAGFVFDFVIAFFAHYMISDGEQGGAFTALVLVIISKLTEKHIA